MRVKDDPATVLFWLGIREAALVSGVQEVLVRHLKTQKGLTEGCSAHKSDLHHLKTRGSCAHAPLFALHWNTLLYNMRNPSWFNPKSWFKLPKTRKITRINDPMPEPKSWVEKITPSQTPASTGKRRAVCRRVLLLHRQNELMGFRLWLSFLCSSVLVFRRSCYSSVLLSITLLFNTDSGLFRAWEGRRQYYCVCLCVMCVRVCVCVCACVCSCCWI